MSVPKIRAYQSSDRERWVGIYLANEERRFIRSNCTNSAGNLARRAIDLPDDLAVPIASEVPRFLLPPEK